MVVRGCSLQDADPLLDACLLHAVSHVVECGEHVRKHNEALKASPTQEVPRDQGFTRPRVRPLLDACLIMALLQYLCSRNNKT